MSDVTRILQQIESGDGAASEKLMPLVYDELRKLAAARMANEKPGQTLQATALVHEAFVRLVDLPQGQRWNGRGHFFAAAAESMRRILVENARKKGREKRGGQMARVDLQEADLVSTLPADELLALDEALQLLAEKEPEKAELVKLRFFAGMSVEEAAESLDISRTTAFRSWEYARAWLYARLHPDI